MKTLLFLIANREKTTDLKRFFILCIKRILLFFPLMKIIFNSNKLTKKGAKVGLLSIIGDVKIEARNLSGLNIGEECSLGKVEIALHDKVTIGNRVVLNDGVVLLTASHSLSDPKWRHKKSPISIGDYAWIATNSIILPGVTIGKGAVVGAGAVVREDIPDYAIVTGNPAKIVENRNRTDTLDYSPVLFNAPFEAWVGKKI